jgi:hypothetical protein
VYQITECEAESSLFKYNLTIIRSVGSIVVVVKVKSHVTSTGVDASTQPTSATPADITVPYPVPAEFANSIVTYASI